MRCQVARPVRAARGKRIGNNPDTAPRSDPYIIGTDRSAIGTLVERTTRYVILLHMPGGVSTAENVREAISAAFAKLPDGLRRTLTWDQGKELALHQQITEHTGAGVFFCDAHSPWQRGSNENMNGLLRDYFPKATDLAGVDADELRRVAEELNDRPRKTLGWRRPGDLSKRARRRLIH